MPVAHRETVSEQGVEAVLLDVGETHVELLRPLGPETPVGRFLDRNGPGPAPRRLPGDGHRGDARAARPSSGIELIDTEPRIGIRQSRVAFLHPRATGSVLTEIVEPAEGH